MAFCEWWILVVVTAILPQNIRPFSFLTDQFTPLFVTSGLNDQLEAAIETDLSLFRRYFPKTDIRARFTLFPSLTESRRVRSNTDLRMRYEIVDDLFWDLSFYLTTDSHPPQGAAKEDYGTVGYEF